jgi:hypothetical protein
MKPKMKLYLRFEFKRVALNWEIEQLEKVRRLSGLLKPKTAAIMWLSEAEQLSACPGIPSCHAPKL